MPPCFIPARTAAAAGTYSKTLHFRKSKMDNKTLSIVSYITLIGWLIAFFMGKDKADDLLKYHLRQSLGLMLVSIVFSVALSILVSIVPFLGFLSFVSLIFLVLAVLGILNAANGAKKPLPVIGGLFENAFGFIG
jgi:uncharacterized membrane protein